MRYLLDTNTEAETPSISNCSSVIFPIQWRYELLRRHHDRARKTGGKPCIRGLRITVYDVLEYLASGMSHADVLQEFPYLTEEDIRACLAYAADRERKLEISKA